MEVNNMHCKICSKPATKNEIEELDEYICEDMGDNESELKNNWTCDDCYIKHINNR